jgi:hypothetical protein
MPMAKDPQGGGSEADGSKSVLYCSHCYENGAFTRPDVTADQMRDAVIAKLRELHFPQPLARFMTRNLHQLARWNRPSNS